MLAISVLELSTVVSEALRRASGERPRLFDFSNGRLGVVCYRHVGLSGVRSVILALREGNGTEMEKAATRNPEEDAGVSFGTFALVEPSMINKGLIGYRV